MTNIIYKFVAARMRKQWKAGDDKRDANYVIPDNVEVIKDISYGKYGKWNLLDINRPAGTTSKLPCIVSMHGGGFFYGTKETYRYYAADLAARGFVVINYNYRLSPENNFPKQIEDCNQVLCWLEQNAEKFNIDLNNVFFVGDSAGGNLVYNTTVFLTNPEYSKMFEFAPSKIKPKAVAMNCAVYEMDLGGKDLMRSAYIGSSKKYLHLLKYKDYLNADFPPSFMMSAPNDFLLNQLKPAEDYFTSKGVKVTSKVYGTKEDPNACHVFHVNLKLPYAKECNDDECNFFKSFM